MKDLEEIRGRCRMVDGHWIWAGATRVVDGRPSIWAPDFTIADGQMRTQSGMRAVWHCSTGRPIPPGYRVFNTCDEWLCLNPAHLKCTTQADFGKRLVKTGQWKGQSKRIVANRKTAQARSVLTPELIAEIQASVETGVAIARRLGIAHQHVSKARRGGYVAHAQANRYAALMGG